MGGKGETVSYKRLRAVNKKERENIKQKVIKIIDATATDLTIITLVKEPKRLRRKAQQKRTP